MNNKKQLAHFISRFEVITFSMCLIIMVVVFEIFNNYDAQQFTLLTLGSLTLNTIVLKKFGYLIDVYEKKKIMQGIAVIMAVLVAVLSMTAISWLYLLIFMATSLLFNILFSVYNAMSQTLSGAATQFVSASMEVVAKLVYLTASFFIWLLFDELGSQWILMMCSVLLVIGFFLFKTYRTPVTSVASNTTQFTTGTGDDDELSDRDVNDNTHSLNTNNKYLGFRWMFRQPIIWLISLTIICNLMVLASNTINNVYLYQVLNETPETLSLLAASFSVGSLVSSVGSFWLRDEKKVIYVSFALSACMSVFIAMQPTITMFIISSFIFGFGNSVSRVMSRSLIMKIVPDSQSGTFYSLRSSMVSGIQFCSLALMTLVITYISPSTVVWFYPALLLVMPLLWLAKVKFARDTSLKVRTQTA